MDELLEKLKLTRWWTILKALPFDGGPSSTRWVFIGAFSIVSLCLLLLVGSVAVVYVHSADHHVDAVLCGLIGVQLTAMLGFATNTQNTMHKLDAQGVTPPSPAAPAAPPNS